MSRDGEYDSRYVFHTEDLPREVYYMLTYARKLICND